METVLLAALEEGLKSGRIPFWVLIGIALAWAALRASAKVGAASLEAAGYLAQIKDSANKIASSVDNLAKKTEELPSTIKQEHQLTRIEVEKVRSQVLSSQAALEKVVDADGDETRKAIADHRTSLAATKVGELAAAIEASTDEPTSSEPPPYRPPQRSRSGRS